MHVTLKMRKRIMKAMRITILVLLKKADENGALIDLKNYSAMHFIKYLLSLCSSTGQKLSMASYSNKRLAPFHLFRMYSIKQNEQFTMELTTIFEGFKRQIEKEKHNGYGIQSYIVRKKIRSIKSVGTIRINQLLIT